MKAIKRQSRKPRRRNDTDTPHLEYLTPTSVPNAASWLRYVSGIQAETFYFFRACSSRMVETMQRFATCRKFEDVVDAQATLVGDLLSDFAEEGALMASLLCDPAAPMAETSAKAETG